MLFHTLILSSHGLRTSHNTSLGHEALLKITSHTSKLLLSENRYICKVPICKATMKSKDKIGIIINFFFLIKPKKILTVWLTFCFFPGNKTKVLGPSMNIIEVLFLNPDYPSDGKSASFL